MTFNTKLFPYPWKSFKWIQYVFSSKSFVNFIPRHSLKKCSSKSIILVGFPCVTPYYNPPTSPSEFFHSNFFKDFSRRLHNECFPLHTINLRPEAINSKLSLPQNTVQLEYFPIVMTDEATLLNTQALLTRPQNRLRAKEKRCKRQSTARKTDKIIDTSALSCGRSPGQSCAPRSISAKEHYLPAECAWRLMRKFQLPVTLQYIYDL